ncbi:hypothetical protein [Desulforhabdus sp. TSK]|uniref:hypothetical protein n=1 Tax=Desulforhabdus sp. TSK TaxID=2925014 RepID=UPI001FC8BBEE|nr:hypothetical protein [Desulforhabdus sp. TSK]GKT10546.1 hypothetical protein DSTSK_38510 [Desulforhabdus sp. TSK]
MQIKLLQENDRRLWDAYVHEHPKGGLYHLSGWKNVIEEAYGHKTYYLMATPTEPPERNAKQTSAAHAAAPQTMGILPLVHLKRAHSPFFTGRYPRQVSPVSSLGGQQ